MASTVAALLPSDDGVGVPLARLYALRATYLLLVAGLGATVMPAILDHEPLARGIIPSLLSGVWLLAFIGLKHPLAMLPLLMFEFAWKSVWLLAFGFAQWQSGRQPTTFGDDVFAVAMGVILMPIVIPWGYVWRRYVKQPGDRWR